MAIYFSTNSASRLLVAFENAIKQKSITTWEENPAGLYTHKAAQWAKKLWLVPAAEQGRLAFYTRPPKGKRIDHVDYAFYHGHLIETFINHFPSDFTLASATPQPTSNDKMG